MRTLPGVALIVCLAVGPLAAQIPSPFTEEAILRGLDFTMLPFPQAQGYLGQGCGFVDLDSDGDPDVVIIGRADGRVGIFENDGEGFFTDHTLTSGIPVLQEQESFASADYDADGKMDLYLTQTQSFPQQQRPNYLMRNLGGFTFSNVTGTAGVGNGFFKSSTGVSWGDYNNDGWPDLYVPNYEEAVNNALYMNNNGNGTFQNLAASLGVLGVNALSLQSVWTDYDRDGDVDLYLSNDRAQLGWAANMLFRNNGGTSFTDVSAASGADVEIYSMGIAAGDVDNDGYPDYYLTNVNSWEPSGHGVSYDGINPLLRNQGNGTFDEQAEAWEVDNRLTSWSAIFFDWDNDGHKDLYVNNQFVPNSFFHCEGAPLCTELAQPLGIGSAKDPTFDLPDDPPTIVSYGSAVADVDGDGDLDLLVNNVGYRAELFINHEGEKRNWVRYDVVGVHPNLFALGVGVDTTAGGMTQFHENYAGGNGYLGQNELILHVGLGDAEKVDQALFRWPSNGPTRTLTGLPAGQTWKIYPPSRLCDANGNGGSLTYSDFVAFAACFIAGFSPGCEMMDRNGDSYVYADDLGLCVYHAPADCNGNGTEDLAEIALDLGLDANANYVIDCCQPGPAKEPGAIGNTLRLGKNGAGEVLLSWVAPAVDGAHNAATAYDVFRQTTAPNAPFNVLAQVAQTGYTDSDTSPPIAFYLVSARNSCGSSGEEPF